MSGHLRGRARRGPTAGVAALAGVAMVLSACAGFAAPAARPGSSSAVAPVVDKAGGGEPPVTLTLGTAEFQGNPLFPVLQHFVDAVSTASSGRVTITIVPGAAGDANDFETDVIRQVQGGAVDIGVVGSRAWDLQHVFGLQALQAPFLVDSYPLLDQILSGSLSDQLLGSFDPDAYVGLGLLPDELRHPLGFTKPIATVGDFQDLHIRVPASDLSDRLMAALGAVPEHLNGPAEKDAVASGELGAAETSVGNATPFPLGSVMTSNVTFFPLVRVLFMNALRFSALSPTVQAVLRQAAKDTQAWALGQDQEPADVGAFCQTGDAFAVASDATVKELVDKAAPIYQELRADATTASLIDQIQALKSGLGAPTSPAYPS
jgi:TRAP-type C4-dicarboxylate transport system substrate-binding protein